METPSYLLTLIRMILTSATKTSLSEWNSLLVFYTFQIMIMMLHSLKSDVNVIIFLMPVFLNLELGTNLAL